MHRKKAGYDWPLQVLKAWRGKMSICVWDKKIRDDEGSWQNIEAGLKKHLVQNFTHPIFNDCAQKSIRNSIRI
jgi:hypothetical protein